MIKFGRLALCTQTYQLSVFDMVLAIKLAQTIHGTDDAMRETARRCRDKVRAEYQPQVSRIMRHPKIRAWLDEMMVSL